MIAMDQIRPHRDAAYGIDKHCPSDDRSSWLVGGSLALRTNMHGQWYISKKARSIRGPIGADGLIQDSHGLAGPDRALHGLAYN